MTDQPTLFLLTEAAERTGLTVDALRKRVKRGKLQTVKGNDGLVRVRLTAADMASLRLDEGQPAASRPEEENRRDNALEAEVAALRQRVDQLQAEREEARIQAAHAEGEAKALREALARERERADRVEREREAVRVQGAAAEGEARVLREAIGQAEEDRQTAEAELAGWAAGSPFARAWRALVYRRGRA